MAAPNGNRFWEARNSHGRKPKFRSAKKLWEACCEYFEWVEDNPLLEAKLTSYQGENKIEAIPKMRAMTVVGLCLHLGITQVTWGAYRDKEGFSYVTTRVDDIIREQKFVGAAADLLNANIIARDLGLRDKKDVEHSGKVEGGDINQLDIANRIVNFLELAKNRMPKND
jgi:hypothetical protein